MNLNSAKFWRADILSALFMNMCHETYLAHIFNSRFKPDNSTLLKSWSTADTVNNLIIDNFFKRLSSSIINILVLTAFIFLSLVTNVNAADEIVVKDYICGFNYSSQMACYDIIQDNRGLIYIGTERDVREYDGVNWRLIYTPDSIAAFSFNKDQDGKIYVGCYNELGFIAPDNQGVIRFYSLLDKLIEPISHPVGRVFQVVASPGGMFYIADHTIYQYSNDKLYTYNSNDHYLAALYALDNSYYVLERDRGMLRWGGDAFLQVPYGQFIRSQGLMSWDTGGLLIVEPNAQPQIFTPTTLPEIAGESGSQYFKQAFSYQDQFFKDNRVIDIVPLPAGQFAVGTEKNGVGIIDSTGRLQFLIDVERGLQSNNIFALFLDNHLNLWIGTDIGASYIHVGDYTSLATPVTASASADTTTSSVTPPFTAIIRRCEGVSDDSLIFGGAFFRQARGASVLEQTEVQKFVFPYNYNAFRLFFSTNRFNAEEIEYQVRLEGFELDWSNWSDRHWKEYTNLYWGKYLFHVRARDKSGEVSREATFTFKIKPPWYETWWYYGGQVVLLILLLVTSTILNVMGKAQGTSNYLTNIVVVVIFKYINMAIGPFVSVYAAGVAFFQIVMSILVGLVINPAQNFITRMMSKVTHYIAERKRKKEEGEQI